MHECEYSLNGSLRFYRKSSVPSKVFLRKLVMLAEIMFSHYSAFYWPVVKIFLSWLAHIGIKFYPKGSKGFLVSWKYSRPELDFSNVCLTWSLAFQYPGQCLWHHWSSHMNTLSHCKVLSKLLRKKILIYLSSWKSSEPMPDHPKLSPFFIFIFFLYRTCTWSIYACLYASIQLLK